MATEHGHLPTDKLVLWSSSGFSKAACQKAEALNISTMSQRRTGDNSWANMARQLIQGKIKYLEADFKAFMDVQLGDGTRQRHPAAPDFTLRQLPGSLEASIGNLLVLIRAEPGVRTTLLDHAPEGSGIFYLEYTPPFPRQVFRQGTDYGLLTRLGIEVRSVVQSAALDACSVLYDGKIHTLARAPLSNGGLELLITEQPNASPTVVATRVPEVSDAQ
jgi:hypothetical protein